MTNQDLHAAIMNLPCDPNLATSIRVDTAYKQGFRDARHAAAELALASSPQSPGGGAEPIKFTRAPCVQCGGPTIFRLCATCTALSAQSPAPEVAPVRAVEQQPIAPMEMALCESVHLGLRPDQPYVFRAIAGCKECEALAAPYAVQPAATPAQATQGGAEPFGYWHQGATEEESDFFKHSDSGNVACETCIKLYDHAAPVRAVEQQPELQNIEQYRMQMAGISTAALGYWKKGDPIHPDYVTMALHDVARLYVKYDTLFQADLERRGLATPAQATRGGLYETTGYALAMRVMQSDLYPKLDGRERSECDSFIAEGQGQATQGGAEPLETGRIFSLADVHADDSLENGNRVFDRGGLIALVRDVERLAATQAAAVEPAQAAPAAVVPEALRQAIKDAARYRYVRRYGVPFSRDVDYSDAQTDWLVDKALGTQEGEFADIDRLAAKPTGKEQSS